MPSVYEIVVQQGYGTGYGDAWTKLQGELQAKEREEAGKIERACLEELQQKDPANIYYSANVLRATLATFFTADQDKAGRISLNELLQHYQPKNQKDLDEIRDFFAAVDITGDQKLNLTEFFILGVLGNERKEGKYAGCKKVD